tara:strand:- start:338 stop:499 length:162 start_codon:yes stop_codon:yes gene_type:complete
MTCDDKQKQHNDIHSIFFFEERNAVQTTQARTEKELDREREPKERNQKTHPNK